MHVLDRAPDSRVERFAVGELRRNRRGKRTAGAVSVRALDFRVAEGADVSVVKNVDHSVALEVTALEQHGPRAHLRGNDLSGSRHRILRSEEHTSELQS